MVFLQAGYMWVRAVYRCRCVCGCVCVCLCVCVRRCVCVCGSWFGFLCELWGPSAAAVLSCPAVSCTHTHTHTLSQILKYTHTRTHSLSIPQIYTQNHAGLSVERS